MPYDAAIFAAAALFRRCFIFAPPLIRQRLHAEMPAADTLPLRRDARADAAAATLFELRFHYDAAAPPPLLPSSLSRYFAGMPLRRYFCHACLRHADFFYTSCRWRMIRYLLHEELCDADDDSSLRFALFAASQIISFDEMIYFLY